MGNRIFSGVWLWTALISAAFAIDPRDVPEQAMLMAAEFGRVDLVAYAIDQGADIDARDTRPARNTALMLAAKRGHTAVVRFLLRRGARVDARSEDGWTALMHAAHGGFDEVLEALIVAGANLELREQKFGNTALILGAARGHAGIVRKLNKAGANPGIAGSRHGNTALMQAAAIPVGFGAVVELIAAGVDLNARAKDGWTALMAASRRGIEPIVEVLLLNEAEVNLQTNDGRTALTLAAQGGHELSVGLLLDNQAHLDTYDTDGWSALGYAILGGHTPIVDRLLAAGADPEMPAGDDLPAVLLVARGGDSELLRLLLEYHVNVNRADPMTGNTPLMLAANRGAIRLVALLINAGADVNLRAKDGWTALEAARMVGDTEIEGLLKEAGAIDTPVF